MLDDRTCVGVIVGAHGIHGNIKVKSFTADPTSIVSFNYLQSEDGLQRLTLEELRSTNEEKLIIKFKEVSSREEAQALRGMLLYIDRVNLPEIQLEDEFYYSNLLGLKVFLTDKSVLGTVVSVQDFGGGDLLEVEQSKPSQKVLLPFTRIAFPEVNIEEGYLQANTEAIESLLNNKSV
jgi:16S rRNA processing protein RimM